jgi:sialate O-acetylesterase
MSRLQTSWYAGVCVLVFAHLSHAEVKLPSVLASHMVLQRDKPVPIWGTANAGEEVTVKFGEATPQKTKANEAGEWKVELPAMKANDKGQTLTINSIELKDILIGEVWVGSGQSNMEWSMAASADPAKNIAAATKPNIRLFHVPKVQAKEPAKTVTASWAACSPETVKNFSAVLYHFGVELQDKLNVPLGLINSSWGGSRIEPWTIANNSSGGMYNGMIAPLLPYAIRGVIWYQGESNNGEGMKSR